MYMNNIGSEKKLELLVDDSLAKNKGMMLGHQAKKISIEQVYYKGRFGEFVLEVDVFPHEKGVMAHIYCPVCSTAEKPHNLQITPDKKKIEWDKDRGLSVEPFACSWEMPTAGAHQKASGQSNIIVKADTMCRWKVVIENNRARDA
jgi:hypothetical protein